MTLSEGWDSRSLGSKFIQSYGVEPLPDWMKHADMSRTLAIGRWQDAKTARIYFREGAQLILEQHLTPHQMQCIRAFTRYLH